ncbi:MAG: hypothetical protein LBO75_00245 [Bifidobacteriaceae bacterium]|nr:hypothetical protein [Bifidobacteriaceae bacterium]
MAVVSVSFGFSAAANAQTVAVDTKDSVTTTVKQLVADNPGVTAGQIRQELTRYAKEKGITFETAVREAAKESSQHRSNKTLSSGGGKADKAIGKGKNKGDVFYSPVSTAGITHGHSGIYYTEKKIVEAPGPGKKVRNTEHTNVKVAKNSKKQHVNTTQAKRDKAANKANTFVGRSYNYLFVANKTSNGAMNCSQVVWVGYKDGSGIDLDSNGGPGVYPSDILNSSWTKTYETIS